MTDGSSTPATGSDGTGVGASGVGAAGAGTAGSPGTAALRWLAFDHPGSPEPVGLLRVGGDGLVEYLDRDGSWAVDPALTPGLLEGRTHEVPAEEAARIAERLRAGGAGQERR